ncbi:MAG: hypothetical protein V1653_03610 [bacterium]
MDEVKVDLDVHIKDIQEISIALDSWDDIFSDFDPSPLEQRILSEDFLLELKKRYREARRGQFIITIYAPLSLKDDSSERLVIKRLKQYFKFRHLTLKKEIISLRLKGLIFVVSGTMALGFLTLIAYYKVLSTFILDMVGIVLVPLGWFGIWEGFSRIIEPSPRLIADAELFEKLSKASIKFKYGPIKAVESISSVSETPTEKQLNLGV